MKVLALLAAAALLGAACVLGCSQVYTRDDFINEAPHRHLLAEGASCHYNHEQGGVDWPAHDKECGWSCSGISQSPISIPRKTHGSLKRHLKANTQFGTAKNVRVLNIGHALQVEFDAPTNGKSSVVVFGDSIYNLYNESNPNDPKLKPKRYAITPLQFHMHSTSEHLLGGQAGEMELHIVTAFKKLSNPNLMPKECRAADKNCLAVFGVVFRINADATGYKGDPLIQKIIDNLPQGCEATGKTCRTDVKGWDLDLQSILPSMDYVTYTGSLTTPPCSEGVMWHVFPKVKATLNQEQAMALQSALATANDSEGHPIKNRLNNREVRPIGDRHIYSVA